MRTSSSSLQRLRRVATLGTILLLNCRAIRLAAQPYTFTTYAGPTDSPAPLDGFGMEARFSNPGGVASCTGGILFVTDTQNHTIRKISANGDVTTLAGLAGAAGSADGIGGQAHFNQPEGITCDNTGSLYVADSSNHTIRKITASGVVSTLAGWAGYPGSGDGTGIYAQFNYPRGVAVDGSGNVYVADTWNSTIRKISPAGVVTTVAGTAGSTGSNDGSGAAARFMYPQGVAVDSGGKLFVSDSGNYTIRRITAAGAVTTYAGLAGSRGSADGDVSVARFFYPGFIWGDGQGSVFIADTGNQTIRIIFSSGSVVTVAGQAGAVGSSDGYGNMARFHDPTGIAYGGAGNIYVADTGNSTLRIIANSGIVSTLAGLAAGYGSADGSGAAVGFAVPLGLTKNSNGEIFVTDFENDTIRKISPTGAVTTFAGLPGAAGSADGTVSDARFDHPAGVAADGAGSVYVADTLNHTIRKITAAGEVTTLAGLAGSSGNADGTGAAARFYLPFDVATDSSGNVYVADSGNSAIRKITPAGEVTTFAGLAANYGCGDGAGNGAQFDSPWGIASDSADNLYVADSSCSTIRKITPAGVVTTIAGSPYIYGSTDGTGSGALFYGPDRVAADDTGNLYVADTSNSTIRKITPAGVVTTLAGTAGRFGNLDGTGRSAWFDYPFGIVVDSAGRLLVTDAGSNAIRIGSAGISDSATIDSASNVTGIPRQLDASPQSAVNWSWRQIRRPGNSTVTLSSSASRDPTFTPDSADLYQFRLTAADAAGRAGITTVQLDAGCPLIQSVPFSRDVCSGSASAFSVTASGNPPPTYQWSKNGTPISGATLSSYTIASASASNSGGYSCAVANSCWTAISPTANLTVNTLPPPAVGNSQLLEPFGANLLINWTGIAGASSYAVYQDNAASGGFFTYTGTTTGNGLLVPMPSGNSLFFKTAGVNGCGSGPK